MIIPRLALLLLASALLAGFDLDGRLVGYSFLSIERSELVADGMLVTLRDGSQRTIDLRHSILIGTDGAHDHPRILHQHWLRIAHDGRRASLVCTSAPLLLVAGGCLLLDGVLLFRLLRRRRIRPGSGRDEPSPTAAAPGTAGSAPPRP